MQEKWRAGPDKICPPESSVARAATSVRDWASTCRRRASDHQRHAPPKKKLAVRVKRGFDGEVIWEISEVRETIVLHAPMYSRMPPCE